MPVTKTTRECYEVRDNREWANITLNDWHNRKSMYYCGEITIQSSFGTWGYIWTACGCPFKQFLIDVGFQYVFTKFMGVSLNRFDAEASEREVRKWITNGRRHNSLSKSDARKAWSALEDAIGMGATGDHDFGSAMMDVANALDPNHPLYDAFADPCSWPLQTKYDDKAQGFWEQLWPLFVAVLKAEVAQTAQDAAAIQEPQLQK